MLDSNLKMYLNKNLNVESLPRAVDNYTSDHKFHCLFQMFVIVIT